MDGTVISILTVILSIVATILAFIFIVPEKRRARLNGFGKFLHDTFNFKYLVIEKILQACYILATAFMVIGGFFMLFAVETHGYYRTRSEWIGYYGLIVMILGPIMVRITYEFLMMAILLVKNVIQINSKLKNQDSEKKEDVFKVPTIEVAQKPEDTYCTNCGAKVDGAFCTNCGTAVQK